MMIVETKVVEPHNESDKSDEEEEMSVRCEGMGDIDESWNVRIYEVGGRTE